MSVPVMADAQFGVARILRPYPHFEAVYQGQDADVPIMFTENGKALDSLAAAGTAGYDPQLVAGLSVPMGARIVLYIPFVAWLRGREVSTVNRYEWRILWRLRNVFDYRNARIPYHYPKQGQGVPDTSVVPPASPVRVVLPAAHNPIVYAGNEPSQMIDGRFPPANQSIYIEQLLPTNFPFLKRPLNPGGVSGTIMQGVADPGNPIFGDTALVPEYIIHEVQAVGDEMLIAVRRPVVDDAPDWDFTAPPATGSDFLFSLELGNASGSIYSDIGVYCFVGSAP